MSYRDVKSLKAFSDSIKTTINNRRLEINLNYSCNDYKLNKEGLKPAKDKLLNLTDEYNSLFHKGYEIKTNPETGRKKDRSEAKLIQSLQKAILELDEEIKRWEDKRLIRTESSGKISFYKLWSEKQPVNKGDELMIIIPETTRVFGYAYIPVSNSGKLKEGQ
jgi:hypothetical protein